MHAENPFEPTRFSAQPSEPVLVNTSLTRTMGTLSIVFGSLLLLCGLCSGVYVAVLTQMSPMITAKMQEEVQKDRDAKLEDLKAQEEVAADDEARAEIAKQREKLEEDPQTMPDFGKLYGMGDRRVATFMGIDIGTALVLNILLLVSGIGLLGLGNWARKLGVCVAVLKIVRLVLLYSVFIFVIVPIMISQTLEAVQEISKQQRGGPPMPPQVATSMGTMWTVFAIGTVIVGVIFPALCWYFLTRPTLKAACQPAGGTQYQ